MLIDEYYQDLKNKNLNKAVIVPEEMKVKNSEDEEGWIEWKLAKSHINMQEIKEIEKKYKIHLPEDYLDFIMDKQFLDMQISNYTIHGINSLNTLNKEASLFSNNTLEKGFFPIGSIDDADYLVLNTESSQVTRLSFEDYSEVEIVSKSFTDFLILLDKLFRKRM